MDKNKQEFLEGAKDFIEVYKLDPTEWLPVLEHDYDILTDLGFGCIPWLKGLLAFYISFDKNRSPLTIALGKFSLKPAFQYKATVKDSGWEFVSDSLDEVLNKIIEEAKS